MTPKISPRWFVLIILLLILLGGIVLAFNLPMGSAVVGSAPTATVTFKSVGATATPKNRPFSGPPATNGSFTISTPEFATNVPLPLTKNFDMAQLATGRALYSQWCATCHGDRGQGLDLWRSSWDPDHQDCTKSGCHGAKHPPDGFAMLKVPPALIGQDSLKAFQNAQQLYIFIRASMPYQAPGVFSDEEYWAVTAFLSDQHSADAGGKGLNDSNAQAVTLR